MSEGESIVALVVLGVIILVLSAILLTLCCLRRRRPGFTNEVLPEGLDEGEGQLAIGYTQELQRSAKFAEAPPKLSRKAVYDELHLDPAYKVTYVTDVEGNWEYFCSFVERADGLYWGSLAPGEFVPQLELREGWRFIFGGDAVDKGGAIGGSLRFCLCLVSLKRRYGDRVTILLGNRDLNKMRLTSELHPGQLGSAVLGALPGPKWIPEGPKRVTPEQYLRKLAAAALGVAPEEVMPSSDEFDDSFRRVLVTPSRSFWSFWLLLVPSGLLAPSGPFWSFWLLLTPRTPPDPDPFSGDGRAAGREEHDGEPPEVQLKMVTDGP